MSGAVIAFLVLARVVRKRRRRLTTLGSARWATENDLRRAGMIGGTGAIIGRLPKELREAKLPSIRGVFDRKINAREACQAFWQRLHSSKDELIRLANAIHTLVVCRSGGGKNVQYVEPFLLSCPESSLVVDPKQAENALLTAEYRRKVFGHRIILLDPYKLATQTPDTLNPLDFIDKDDPQCLDRCQELADALVVREPDEKDPHWNNSAVVILKALIATVVQYG
jgi:type IV secretion system protein VirD4